MNRGIDCWNTAGVRGAATCERLPEVAHCRNCPDYIAAGRMLLDREVPGGAREEWARLIAQPKEEARPGSRSVVVFRIGAEWLALETALFQRAVTLRPVHSVPSRSNRVFRGLVNIEGELLLCFSAGEALGIECGAASRAGRERLLVVSHDGQRLVFTADEVLGVRALAPEDLEPLPATLANAPETVTQSVCSIGGRRVGLLDPERFFQRVARSLAL